MDIPDWLYQYATKVLRDANFDSSHDMTHFLNVYNFAKQIISEEEGELISGLPNEIAKEIILYAAFIHDVVDSKYVNSDLAVKNLKQLFAENNYDSGRADIIIYLISHMSFSKRIKRKKDGLPLIEPGRLHLAMSIVCDADQLDAYRIERAIAYQHHKFGNLEEPEKTKKINGYIKTILVKRVLLYKDEFMNTDTGKRLAIEPHEKVVKYLSENLKDAELFDY